MLFPCYVKFVVKFNCLKMWSNSTKKLRLQIGVKRRNASLFQLSTTVNSQRIQEDLGGSGVFCLFGLKNVAVRRSLKALQIGITFYS